MFRRSLHIMLLLLAGVPLFSCRSPVPVWNDDGLGMTDLRTLRHHGRHHLEVTRGVHLYADSITFTDHREKTGVAVGRVLVEVDPAVRYEWSVRYGYAGRATFDRRNDLLILADRPMLEREMMTTIATEPYTTIELRWNELLVDVVLRGPTRSDFAKSHPLPAGIVLPKSALPPPAARKPLPATFTGKR